MKFDTFDNKQQTGLHAAAHGADLIIKAITKRGEASIIVATGASQFEMLDALVGMPNINWSKVTAFHLDEYVGLPINHPASFRRYLWERFVRRLPTPLRAFHYLDGEGNYQACIREKTDEIARHQIDVAFIGIGENGHLAFNDPPADFETKDPFLVVELDTACRRQQVGEGWFASMADVPTHAITMSVPQIMKSAAIVCTVPDERKAVAVRNTIEGKVKPEVPASILQRHPAARLFLDKGSASLLNC